MYVYDGPEMLMAPLLFKADHSLVLQSYASALRNKPVNGDGFGLGWYPAHDDPEPAVFTSVEPAWSNRNLRMISRKVPTAHYFAHVRDASAGMPVNQANCHPFSRGPFLWMHNGKIQDFARIRRKLLEPLSTESFQMIQGNTDSEHAFALFMDVLGHPLQASLDDLQDALIETIGRITALLDEFGVETRSTMNFAVTNGHSVVVSRHSTFEETEPATLFFGQGQLEAVDGEVRFTPTGQGQLPATIICSEPLFEADEVWQTVAPNHLICLDSNKQAYQRPIGPS